MNLTYQTQKDANSSGPHCRCICTQRTTCLAKSAGCKNGFILNDCKICQHAYINDIVTQDILQEYYGDSAKYSNSSFADDIAKQRFPGSRSDAFRYLKLMQKFSKVSRPRLLEVGAGWGYAAEAATKLGWQADVIEYSNDCIDSLAGRLPKESRICKGSFEEFIQSGTCQYDSILMSQVLEHAINPMQWLSSAGSLLRDGGILVVAVPLYKGFYRFMGLRDPFITPPEHLNFFTKKSLKLAALEAGFSPLYAGTYSRIPYFNIEKRLKAYLPSILVYRILQGIFWAVDQVGMSMIQVQVFGKDHG
jgi:2-polyprenyl-3-methyl-5-hydroxy-6-metoxy-1,4-benzoquinol methylase